jgi:hypothetical protein
MIDTNVKRSNKLPPGRPGNPLQEKAVKERGRPEGDCPAKWEEADTPGSNQRATEPLLPQAEHPPYPTVGTVSNPDF